MPKVPVNALTENLKKIMKKSMRHVVPDEFVVKREDVNLTGDDFIRCSRFFLCGSGTRAQLETLELQLRTVFKASVYGGFVNERYNRTTECGCWECIVTVNKQKAQLPHRGSVMKLLKKIKIECSMDILEENVNKQSLASLSRIYDCDVKVGRFPCSLYPRLEEYRREEKARRVQSSVEDHTGIEMTPDNMFTLYQQLKTLRNVVNSQARSIIQLRAKLNSAENKLKEQTGETNALKAGEEDASRMTQLPSPSPTPSSPRSPSQSPSPSPSQSPSPSPSQSPSQSSSLDSSITFSMTLSPYAARSSNLSPPSMSPSSASSSSSFSTSDALMESPVENNATSTATRTRIDDEMQNRYQVFFSISDNMWPQIKVGDRVVMKVKHVRYPDVLLEFGDRALSVMSDTQSMLID